MLSFLHRLLFPPSSSSPPAPSLPSPRPSTSQETPCGLPDSDTSTPKPPPSITSPSASLPAPPPPHPPKASLSTLPRELKLKIVEEVHAASAPPANEDPFRRFSELNDHLRRREEEGHDWEPSSLDWLSLVNTEFKTLATAYLVQDVDLRGLSCSSLDHLVHRILPAYGSRVRRLHLMTSIDNPLLSNSGKRRIMRRPAEEEAAHHRLVEKASPSLLKDEEGAIDLEEALDVLLASALAACSNLEALHGVDTASFRRHRRRTLAALRRRNRLNTIVITLTEEEEEYAWSRGAEGYDEGGSDEDDEDDEDDEGSNAEAVLHREGTAEEGTGDRESSEERSIASTAEEDDDVLTLGSLLSAVRGLEHLQLRPQNDHYYRSPSQRSLGKLDALVTLRSLSLLGLPPSSISSFRIPPLVTALHIELDADVSYEELCKLLLPVAATLQHLSIDLEYSDDPYPDTALRLPSLTHLQISNIYSPLNRSDLFSLPSLTHISLDTLDSEELLGLHSTVQQFSTLRSLEVDTPEVSVWSRYTEASLEEDRRSLSRLRVLCKQQGVKYRLPRLRTDEYVEELSDPGWSE